jgi:hypothetical protein
MTIFNLPRHERTPETEVDVILTNLSILHHEFYPDKGKFHFIHYYFEDFYKNEHTSGDALVSINNDIYPQDGDGIAKVTKLGPLVISCAYCCQALRAWEAGKTMEAWMFVVDAVKWCSQIMARHPGIDRLKAREHAAAVSAARRESRKKGADKYDYSEFILGMYNSRPWKDKTEAIKKISDALKEHVEAHNLPVRVFKNTNERGEIIKEKQTDFYRIVENTLPSAAQVKRDRDRFKNVR